jgi:hypothetical protein
MSLPKIWNQDQNILHARERKIALEKREREKVGLQLQNNCSK